MWMNLTQSNLTVFLSGLIPLETILIYAAQTPTDRTWQGAETLFFF